VPRDFQSRLANQTIPFYHLRERDGYRAVAYYVNWAIYARNHPPSEIPVEKLNYVHYAFANVNNITGEVFLSDTFADIGKRFPGDSANETGTNMYGCLKQINLLKRKNRNLKVLLSIGGWGFSPNFAVPMASEAGRKVFAKSSVRLLKDLGFDGLDVDWEYPMSKIEGQYWVDVLRRTREELDMYEESLEKRYNDDRIPFWHRPKRPHFYLTIAAPAGPEKYERLDVAAMEPFMDFVNLMAYDYSGAWDNTTGHNSNLYPSRRNPASTPFNTVQALRYYITGGIPSEKMVLGMPLYGRSFLNTRGPEPGKPYNDTGVGSWEKGVWDYKALPRPGSREYFDPTIGASWSYDNQTREFVSYDTKPLAIQKSKYIREESLGGAMWWETSYDKSGSESLISTVGRELTRGRGQMEVRMNVLDYPESRYDNLRTGFADSDE
jgi:chitinase